jgi:hypothetical protein
LPHRRAPEAGQLCAPGAPGIRIGVENRALVYSLAAVNGQQYESVPQAHDFGSSFSDLAGPRTDRGACRPVQWKVHREPVLKASIDGPARRRPNQGGHERRRHRGERGREDKARRGGAIQRVKLARCQLTEIAGLSAIPLHGANIATEFGPSARRALAYVLRIVRT